jgi:biotin-dependent carboxylase-like uncharacterized protein
MSPITILKPGVLSTIQDEGRLGVLHEGITESGSMDRWSARCANELCLNSHLDAVIEVNLGGLECRVESSIAIAVTGGFSTLQINGEFAEMWRSHVLHEGDIIQLGFCQHGARLYLGVSGGIQVSPTLNSRSTTLNWGIGGLSGRALAIGDTLACSPPHDHKVRRISVRHRPSFSHEVNLPILPYSQYGYLTEEQRSTFFTTQYKVDERCDRMGYRLIGESVQPPSANLYSEGLVCGAIQLPPDGQPFILMRDHQSIGGYPKMGSVLGPGIDELSQSVTGTRIQFSPQTHSQALQINNGYLHRLGNIPIIIDAQY